MKTLKFEQYGDPITWTNPVESEESIIELYFISEELNRYYALEDRIRKIELDGQLESLDIGVAISAGVLMGFIDFGLDKLMSSDNLKEFAETMGWEKFHSFIDNINSARNRTGEISLKDGQEHLKAAFASLLSNGNVERLSGNVPEILFSYTEGLQNAVNSKINSLPLDKIELISDLIIDIVAVKSLSVISNNWLKKDFQFLKEHQVLERDIIQSNTRAFHQFKFLMFASYSATQLAFGMPQPFSIGLSLFHGAKFYYKDSEIDSLLYRRNEFIIEATYRTINDVSATLNVTSVVEKLIKNEIKVDSLQSLDKSIEHEIKIFNNKRG